MSKLIVNTIEAQTYKYDSDTTGFLLNSAGAITSRNPYHWQVRRHAGTVSATSDIVFDQVDADDNSIYDSSTGILTIPVTGVYQMNILAISSTGDVNGTIGVYNQSNALYDNMMIYFDATNYYTNASYSFAKKFTAGNQVKLRVTAGSIYASNGSGNPVWSGYLVG